MSYLGRARPIVNLWGDPMKSISRRRFMQATAGAVAASGLAGELISLRADPLGLPVGLQLYTVGGDMLKDFDGTLKKIAGIG
jgi:hypothetical protein